MPEVLLSNGDMAIVDDADYDRVAAERWFRNGRYAYHKTGPTTESMHRFLLGHTARYIDHANGNGLDMKDKRRKRWRAAISVDGRKRIIGYFATDVEAAHAYDAAAVKAWGEFARTNFPRS